MVSPKKYEQRKCEENETKGLKIKKSVPFPSHLYIK